MKNLLKVLFISLILFSCKDKKTTLVNQIDELTATMKQEDFPSKENMEKIISLYNEYITEFPEDEQTYNYLELKAKYQSASNQFEEAIATYDKIINKYPNNEKNADALFMQAFIYENHLNDKTKAKEIYTKFLEHYPTHELASSAQFSIENLFLSDDEIIAKFKQNNATNLEIMETDSL